MDIEIKDSIEAIRQSGKSNMMDYIKVQYIAYQKKHYKLVVWMKDHKKEYMNYILTGEEPKD